MSDEQAGNHHSCSEEISSVPVSPFLGILLPYVRCLSSLPSCQSLSQARNDDRRPINGTQGESRPGTGTNLAEGKTQNPDARPGTKRHKKKVPPKKKTPQKPQLKRKCDNYRKEERNSHNNTGCLPHLVF